VHLYGRPRSNLTACFSIAGGIFRFSQKACPSSAKTQMRRLPLPIPGQTSVLPLQPFPEHPRRPLWHLLVLCAAALLALVGLQCPVSMALWASTDASTLAHAKSSSLFAISNPVVRMQFFPVSPSRHSSIFL